MESRINKIKFKFSSKINFLQDDMYKLANYASDRFMVPLVKNDLFGNQLVYDVDNSISLLDYLNIMVLNKKIFIVIISQFIDGLCTIDKLSLDSRKVLFSLDNVYIEPSSQRLWFIYIPVNTYTSVDTAETFLKSFMKFARFAEYENSDYLNEFYSIVKKDKIPMFDISVYVNNLSNGQIRTPIQHSTSYRCRKCNAIVNNGDQICPDCGTILFNEKIPCVVRLKTQEKTLLDSSSVLLGKNLSECKVFVGDNPLISRKHAQIQNILGVYYLVDIGSTNGTYIDGQRLKENEKYRLKSNMRFRLANEEFIFFDQ